MKEMKIFSTRLLRKITRRPFHYLKKIKHSSLHARSVENNNFFVVKNTLRVIVVPTYK